MNFDSKGGEMLLCVIGKRAEIARKAVEWELRQWGQPVNTQEQLDSLEGILKFSESGDVDDLKGLDYPEELMIIDKQQSGGKWLNSKAAQVNPEIKKLAEDAIKVSDEGIKMVREMRVLSLKV